MAVKEMDYRCWVLDYPAGAGDDGRHFKTEADARARAYPPDPRLRSYAPYGEQAIPRQLPAACYLVVCDTAACGEELENEGDGWTVHLANPADAENEAVSEGWTTEDGVLACYYCADEAETATTAGED